MLNYLLSARSPFSHVRLPIWEVKVNNFVALSSNIVLGPFRYSDAISSCQTFRLTKVVVVMNPFRTGTIFPLSFRRELSSVLFRVGLMLGVTTKSHTSKSISDRVRTDTSEIPGLEKNWLEILCITRFVTPRFVNKTRFVNNFFRNENVTNRVPGGFQKTKCQIYFSR